MAGSAGPGCNHALELDVAAPLLCAGVTTYSPLNRWNAGPGRKVAIVGLGGLGHMTVKVAQAMGAEVTVPSQSLKKQEDGLRLGAQQYLATSNPATFEQLAATFDLIVNTVSAPIDVNAYLGLLAVDGVLVNVGAPSEPLSLNVFSLIMSRRSYAGSVIGGVRETHTHPHEDARRRAARRCTVWRLPAAGRPTSRTRPRAWSLRARDAQGGARPGPSCQSSRSRMASDTRGCHRWSPAHAEGSSCIWTSPRGWNVLGRHSGQRPTVPAVVMAHAVCGEQEGPALIGGDGRGPFAGQPSASSTLSA